MDVGKDMFPKLKSRISEELQFWGFLPYSVRTDMKYNVQEKVLLVCTFLSACVAAHERRENAGLAGTSGCQINRLCTGLKCQQAFAKHWSVKKSVTRL